MSKLQLNENIFIFFDKGKILLWDYSLHNQYELDKKTLEQIIQASSGKIDKEKMSELIKEKIITPKNESIKWGWDILSKIYHLGCNNLCEYIEHSPENWIEKYIDGCKNIEKNENCLDIEGEKILLPSHTLDKMAPSVTWQVMQRRMTNRLFYDEPIELQELVNIISAGFGKTHQEISEYKEKGYEETTVRKAHPSGGGLHPLECFLFIYNVNGLSPGIYYYNWEEHCLIALKKSFPISELISCIYGQYYVQNIACGVLLCNNNSKSWVKYKHSRCYRDVYVDLGHCQQTIVLVATELGLETWQTGWFREDVLCELIGIDGNSIVPTGFIGLGHGSRESIPHK